MMMALVQSLRSPDPNTQVGACITSPNNTVLGTGYNGWPRGISNHCLPWNREGDPLNVKYTYVVHAEANAILNSKADLEGSTLYVTLYPCNSCATLILQKGIKRVVYLNNPYKDGYQAQAAAKMFEIRDIDVSQLEYSAATLDAIRAFAIR